MPEGRWTLPPLPGHLPVRRLTLGRLYRRVVAKGDAGTEEHDRGDHQPGGHGEQTTCHDQIPPEAGKESGSWAENRRRRAGLPASGGLTQRWSGVGLRRRLMRAYAPSARPSSTVHQSRQGWQPNGCSPAPRPSRRTSCCYQRSAPLPLTPSCCGPLPRRPPNLRSAARGRGTNRRRGGHFQSHEGLSSVGGDDGLVTQRLVVRHRGTPNVGGGDLRAVREDPRVPFAVDSLRLVDLLEQERGVVEGPTGPLL